MPQTDTTLWTHARFNDLRVPPGKYYLADAGFGFTDFLLTPYTGHRYHLAEWGRADVRQVVGSVSVLLVYLFS